MPLETLSLENQPRENQPLESPSTESISLRQFFLDKLDREAVLVRKALDLHIDAIGQLLPQLQCQLLAHDLGRMERFVPIGDYIGGEQRRR